MVVAKENHTTKEMLLVVADDAAYVMEQLAALFVAPVVISLVNRYDISHLVSREQAC